MKRSLVLLLIVVALLAHALTAEAQQPGKIWRIGIFHVGLDHTPAALDPLRQQLTVLGYEQGKNIHLDWRNLPDEEAARDAAKDFVRNRVDLIVAFENQTARAAKAATSDIPIVFVSATEPVAQGFVKSFAHPEGNITGFDGWGELYSKEMELFKEIVPRLHRLLVLIDPQDPQTERTLAEVRQAGAALKLQLLEREVINQADAERVFRSLKRGGVDGVFIASPNLRTKFPALIVSLSSERHLPLAMHRMQWVEKGALFSYGFDARELGRGAATYVDKILKGTKPADLPVQQPPRLELVISLKTAKQIGLTIPPNVLARADKVIR